MRLERRVALRVHAGVVERVRARPGRAGSPPPARTSSSRSAAPRAAPSRDLNSPAFAAVLDDACASAGPDAGDVRQQVVRGGVQVDADLVHAGVDHLVEALLERRLRHVVLVLADADALRIDLHQLGQRILQPARDRDRAAHGEVELGELLARDVAGAVDAGAGLADHHHRHVDARSAGAPRARRPRSRGRRCRCRRRPRGCRPSSPVGQHRRGRGLARRASRGASALEPTYAPDVVDDGELAAGAQARIDAEHRPSGRTARPAAACARSRRTPRSPPRRPPRAAPCGPRSRSTARRARAAPGARRA